MSSPKAAAGPKAAAAPEAKVPEACTLVIFGASGDLAKRKILPALYQLWRDGHLPKDVSIVGFARTRMDDAEFARRMLEAVNEFGRGQPPSGAEWRPFAERLHYVAGDYDDAAAHKKLAELLSSIETQERRPCRRLFYLSTPPAVYDKIISQLSVCRAAAGWSRIIIEKPFGSSLEEARALNKQLHEHYPESDIYRIDHYLGKETVQNLFVLRFANGIFEPIWNRDHIDHVQITAAESIGVEGRSGYYEQAGALRDMFQNHMLQLLAIVAMEPPSSFDAEAVRDEKAKLLHAVQPLTGGAAEQRAVRGQYGKGRQGAAEVPGYREEPGVAKDSTVETFAALKLSIDNWRWADVPFYLRAGKRLPNRVTEIAVQFKRAPHLLFPQEAAPIKPNVLTIRIQPDEGISLAFEAKLPGQSMRTQQVEMKFRYADAFGVPPPEAYERLLIDAMLGDPMLFNRADAVDRSWELVMPVLEYWAGAKPKWFPNYAAGTWGPPEAYTLIERDGRWWKKPQ